jgi:hypothetical protein
VSDDLAELAGDAYVYGFALVFAAQQVARFTREGMGSLAAAPFNAFSHATALAGPGDRFVSINNDTVYSIAQVDMGGGPVRLGVPDTAGRYYVLQFVDVWTNNFAYAGRRATGTAAASFLLVPPGWHGDPPAGTRVIEFPTRVGTIVGRWACDGPGDLPAVRDLQRGLVLEAGAGASACPAVPPPSAAPEALAFFEQMRTLTQAFPPSAADRDYQRRFQPLGLLEATSPYADCPPALAGALVQGAAAAKQKMESELKAGRLSPVSNGWMVAYHIFDYNLDHLGPGTIDEAAWKLPDRTASYLVRALAARGGLWGNHGYEAAYAMTFADADGDQLDGRNRYALRFDQPPPADAFWSITMYDLPDFHLVANPVNRYSIGDRTPSLHRDRDGSVTIIISREEPADTANWLPAPAAPFRPILRMYQPRASVLDGTYQIPPIKKWAKRHLEDASHAS